MDKDSLINGYFEGTLSDSEMREFNDLQLTDESFAAEVGFQKELRTALRKEERQDIKEMFSKLKDDSSKKESRVIPIKLWLAAASILLIAGLGTWLLYLMINRPTMKHFTISIFHPYENVVHPIERGNQLEDLRTRAFEAYENADYILALNLFDELNNKQKDPYLDFYSAIVMMQLDQPEQAVPLLNQYIEQEGELKDRAIWYLALAYLKQGQIKDARTQLEKVVQLGTFHTSKAQRLLDELD